MQNNQHEIGIWNSQRNNLNEYRIFETEKRFPLKTESNQ